jgi:hypothetical protein
MFPFKNNLQGKFAGCEAALTSLLFQVDTLEEQRFLSDLWHVKLMLLHSLQT